MLNFLASSTRVLIGPSGEDRVSALVLLSTTGAAVLALLAAMTDSSGLRDAALAIVALAAVIVVVRVVIRSGHPSEPREP